MAMVVKNSNAAALKTATTAKTSANQALKKSATTAKTAQKASVSEKTKAQIKNSTTGATVESKIDDTKLQALVKPAGNDEDDAHKIKAVYKKSTWQSDRRGNIQVGDVVIDKNACYCGDE